MRIPLGVLVSALLLCAYDLPDLPQVNTANFQPAIRAQIERVEAEARAYSRDPKVVGGLAMTLHAYQQYAGAERAYSRAYSLDPRNFDWL